MSEEIKPEPVSYGIKETIELIDPILALGMATERSLMDGKFGVEDIANFMPALLILGNAFEGIKLVPKEIKDLSLEEATQIREHIEKKFDLQNDNIESLIERALSIGLTIYELVQNIKEIKNERRGSERPNS